jgi:predicted dienelactone hydrolase
MQISEVLFLVVLATAIFRLIAGPRYAWLTYPRIAIAGLVLAGFIAASWRWQLLPAGLALALLLLGALKRSDTRLGWRLLGAVPLIALLGSSAVLAWQMPVVSLPPPAGPYGVGTFDFSITDPFRVERYAPGRKRELYVEVWYPADQTFVDEYPARTLFHDLYWGEFNRTSALFGYLQQVDTHSHVNAPPARPGERAFPVLLFNHALDFGFTAQNLRLMEHLASHGYVVLSIAHPYQTSKVNLAQTGTVFRASGIPADIAVPQLRSSRSVIGEVFSGTGDIQQVSRI